MKMTAHSTAGDLIYLLRAQRPTRPVLLLGAGASYRAGIPLARECVQRVAQAAYARREKGQDWRLAKPLPSDWRPYLQKQPWFIAGDDRLADNFPLAVEHLLFPQEFRREFMTELIKPVNGINEGYKRLANLMHRGLCHSVLTTNFDSLIVDALREKGPHVRDIVEINQSEGDLVRFNTYNPYQVVYLHGAVEFYRDQNLPKETERLDENLALLLRPLLKDAPLIVVGYRGFELSVVNHLLKEGAAECGNYKQGIYWCLRRGETLHPHVEELAELISPNLSIVEINGFDELMVDLDEALAEEATYLHGNSLTSSGALDLLHKSGQNRGLLCHNVLYVLRKYQNVCARKIQATYRRFQRDFRHDDRRAHDRNSRLWTPAHALSGRPSAPGVDVLARIPRL